MIPLAARATPADGALSIGGAFTVAVANDARARSRLRAIAARTLSRVAAQTGLPLRSGLTHDPARATLVVTARGEGPALPELGADESYTLEIAPEKARLEAPSWIGVARGVESFLQLIARGGEGTWQIACTRLEDAPRFPWRGLLLDVCRHWMPAATIHRTLDAMAAVKLNVLHLHLSEDQAFRLESRIFPRLHEAGAEGCYLSHEDVRELVEHAAALGIRIVPELDMPGHTTSWLVGHPELASKPGPFELRRAFGIAEVALDPTREEVYGFIDALIGELTTLFPDAFLHIGGDEVAPQAWDESPEIRAYREREGIADVAALQARFNQRVAAILQKHGRRMIGWDEVLHPDLPRDVVVQSWRGPASLFRAVQNGHHAILSSGYYLDHLFPARLLYATDPLADPDRVAAVRRATREDPVNASVAAMLEWFEGLLGDTGPLAPLTQEECARVLGGEACLWSELVNAEGLDQRMWPRTAAFAERLWSRAGIAHDLGGLYARLDRFSTWLELSVGAEHRSGPERMLARLADAGHRDPLRVLRDACEPVKFYARLFRVRHTNPPDRRPPAFAYGTDTPLTRLVDATPPESALARRLAAVVDRLVAAPEDASARAEIAVIAARWRAQAIALAPLFAASPDLAELEPLSRDLEAFATILEESIDVLARGAALDAAAVERHADALTSAAAPCAELELAVLPAVRRLAAAASSPGAHRRDRRAR